MASSPPSSSVFEIREHTIPASHIREYPRATAVSQDEPFLLSVKQYTPKNGGPPRKGDITVVGAHANGFPKELYEPLYEELHKELEKQGLRLRAIWIADAAHQGQSGILNAANLGNDPNWLDYARDILHLINTFRMPRPIIAMGHSFGANALTNVALMHPRLFTGMIMLDPVIARYASPKKLPSSPATYYMPAALSATRRDVWPSRAAAAEILRSKAFYQAWDPRVLDLFIRYGLQDVSTPTTSQQDESQTPVRLTTTKHQEVFTFVRPLWPALDPVSHLVTQPSHAPDHDIDPDSPAYMPFYRSEGNNTAARLPHLRPSVLYIFGGKSDISPSHLVREKMENTGAGVGGSGGAKAGRVKGITHPESGHLVPLEEPVFCAKAAAEWAKVEMDSWWKEEREYEEWAKKPLEEKSTLGDEFMKRLGVSNRQSDKAKANL